MDPQLLCFWGSDPIALPTLEWLAREAAAEVKVAAVITQPDRPSGRGRKLQANAIKQWHQQHSVEIRQPQKPGEADLEWMRSRGFSMGLVMAYGKILPGPLLDAPPLGMWNLHGSVLPDLRGASPLETALAEGYPQTGVTLMRMAPRMDAGPVADHEILPVNVGETAPELRSRAGRACVPLLLRNLAGLLNSTPELKTQTEAAATYCRKLTREDGLLDFNLGATVLERRHRACIPWPGSSFRYEDNVLKVGCLSASTDDAGAPGQLMVEPGRIRVATGAGSLEIESLQRPGGKMLPVAEFLRGFPLRSGTLLNFPESTPWRGSASFS